MDKRKAVALVLVLALAVVAAPLAVSAIGGIAPVAAPHPALTPQSVTGPSPSYVWDCTQNPCKI